MINGKQVANTMRRELRINVTNWEDQLFWMTQTAVFAPVVVLVSLVGVCSSVSSPHTTSC